MVVLSGRLLGASAWAAGLLPALPALALEMDLIAQPPRASTGVPAVAIYRR